MSPTMMFLLAAREGPTYFPSNKEQHCGYPSPGVPASGLMGGGLAPEAAPQLTAAQAEARALAMATVVDK